MSIMDVVKFLEQLATNGHQRINIDLLETLPFEVRNAYLIGDAGYLKSYLSKAEFMANESHVIHIQR